MFELEFAFDDRVARPSSSPHPLPTPLFRFFAFVRNEVSGVQVFSSLRAVIFASLLLSHVCIDGECKVRGTFFSFFLFSPLRNFITHGLR